MISRSGQVNVIPLDDHELLVRALAKAFSVALPSTRP